MKRSFSVFTFFIMMLSTLPLLAVGPGTDSPLIPYHGYLESDGAPAMGPYDFRIELLGASSDPDIEVYWEDTFDGIDVVAGEFSLILGSQALFSPDFFFVDNMQLRISVQPTSDDPDNFILLSGTQRLLQVPYSTRTEGRLDIETPNGVLKFTGPDLKIWGDGRCGDLSIDDCRAQDRRAIVHGTDDILILNFSNDYTGGTKIDSDLDVKGLFSVEVSNGVLEFNGPDLTLCRDSRLPDGTTCQRPGETTGERRRALVHYAGDTLILNFDGDYTGGVEIESDLKVKRNAGVARKSVTVGEESLRIVRSIINAGGGIEEGDGFIVEHTNDTGFYNVYFDPDFSGRPAVTVTQWYGDGFSSAGGDTRDNCLLVFADQTGARILCGNNSGDAEDRNFHFIAVGP